MLSTSSPVFAVASTLADTGVSYRQSTSTPSTDTNTVHIYAQFYFEHERKRVKDSQKSRVYAAEQEYLRIHPADRYLGDIEVCQQFVDRVLARKYVQKHYGVRSISVRGVPAKRRWAHAYNSASRIELGTGDCAKWSRTNSVVLHEMAHILAYRRYTEHIGSHDWAFAVTFLDLVRNVMGADAAKWLKIGYKVHKVRTSPPRTRRMSIEQKDAAAARLEAARAKREEALAPKRVMKERALKLHGKRSIGINNFGNRCYNHYLGAGDRRIRIDKDPKYMSYAEIEEELARFDKQFKPVEPYILRDQPEPNFRRDLYIYERSLLQFDKPYAIITGLTS